MTLGIGDHLRIQRDGKLVEPGQQAWHEYEVVGGVDSDGKPAGYVPYTTLWLPDGTQETYVTVRLKVVK